MDRKIRILVENKIPFIKGRLEPVADVSYFEGYELCPELVKDADALLVRTRDKCNETLLKGSSVKLVATGTIGMDHIDTRWCAMAGIIVYNSAGCNASGVAQYVLASLCNALPSIEGLTLGVIGVGNVGSITAEWAEAAGMKVLACDPPRRLSAEKGRYNPGKWHSLDYVLTHSDVVTLHVPLTREGNHATFHMIGEREMKLMEEAGVKVLVNAARGGVTDTQALIASARRGGPLLFIDTWEGEPSPNHELLRAATTATPHIAGYSAEGKQRATRMLLEAINSYFGLNADTSGLQEAYTPLSSRNATFDIEMLRQSYSPAPATLLLKAQPENFEKFRETWEYRPEPEFATSPKNK